MSELDMSELARRLSGLLSHNAFKENSQNPLAALLSRRRTTFSRHKINREKRQCYLISFYQRN